MNKKWVSHHTSDAGIGKAGKDSCRWGDAFDLYVHYEHGGDTTRAVKAVGETFGLKGFSKDERREYMQNKDREEAYQMFENLEPESEQCENNKPVFSLNQFSMNGMSKIMFDQIKNDKFILGRLAIQGQSTAMYGQYNAGKTLINIALLIESIKNGEINGPDVFYANCDDDFKGLALKVRLAEEYGFNMLAPGFPKENPFDPDKLPEYLKQMDAQGKILFLDTVKKFTDLMRKDLCTKFGKVIREFVSRGGSVIMLGHVNKYKDPDGKVIYSGTTDLIDDADCAYTMEIIEEDQFNHMKTVKFENKKNRGNVAMEAVYRYSYDPEMGYLDKLDSVEELTNDEANRIEKTRRQNEKFYKDLPIIDAVKECLKTENKKQKDIILELDENHGHTKKKVIRVLKAYEGRIWDTAPGQKNVKFYHLIKR